MTVIFLLTSLTIFVTILVAISALYVLTILLDWFVNNHPIAFTLSILAFISLLLGAAITFS